MEYQRLKEVYDRVYAAGAITVRPIPITRPYIIAAMPSSVVVGTEPVKCDVRIRNIGGEPCELKGIDSNAAGITISGFTQGHILRAQTPDSEALVLGCEIRPFDLPDATDEARIDFKVQSTHSSEQSASSTRLRWKRKLPSGPFVLPDRWQLNFAVRLHNLHLFECDGNGAHDVALHVEDGPEKGTYAMVRRDSKFAVALELKDGTYRDYRFCLDGVFRNDRRIPDQSFVPGVNTPCSRLETPTSCSQNLVLRNPSDYELRVRAEIPAPWIDVAPKQLAIPPKASAKIIVTVDPTLVAVGTNEAAIRLTTNATDVLDSTKLVPVQIAVTAPGPVPFANQSYDLGTVYESVENKCSIQISNIGSGELQGQLHSDDPFIADATFIANSGSSVEVPLVISPNSTSGEKGRIFNSRVKVSTNSTVHTRREFQVGVRYCVQGMRFEPPQVDVGTISPSETRTFQIRALRGDGTPFTDIRLQRAPDWLKVAGNDQSGIKITVNGDGFQIDKDDSNPSRSFRGELICRDSRTGATGALPIHGEFAIPKAQAGKLSFGRTRRSERKQLPIPLVNIGAGTLVINGVMLDQPWITVKPWDEEKDASLIAYVGGWDQSISNGTHEGLIEIATNDPVNPIVKVPFKLKLTD